MRRALALARPRGDVRRADRPLGSRNIGCSTGSRGSYRRPVDVAQALWDYRDLLPQHIWVTLWESLAGFLLAIVIGIPVGGLIAYSRARS